MDEDWTVLRSFLPAGWEELGRSTGALKGLRKDKSAESVLRVLLLHLGCGHSLRETSVRARKAGLAQLSDVALLKRLRKSSDWLHGLCVALFRERGLAQAVEPGLRVRAFDATTVREPGRTGSLWRVHYSLCLSSLCCDYFEVTPTRGAGSAEVLARFPVRAGDHILADRGYATAAGLRHVSAAGGRIAVRVNTGALSLRTAATPQTATRHPLQPINKLALMGLDPGPRADPKDVCLWPLGPGSPLRSVRGGNNGRFWGSGCGRRPRPRCRMKRPTKTPGCPSVPGRG